MKTLLRICPLAASLLTLAGCYTNPVTGRKELVLVSPAEELTLGAQSFADVKQKEKVSTNAAYNERVERVGRRIAQAVGNELPNANWEFVVFDSPEVNAFALPGGKVGVYTGLLQMADTDDQLAIVMGHEIGHVIARHGAERMSEQQLLQAGGQLAGAVISDEQKRQLFETAYGGLTTVGRTLPHSRAQESEADRMGVVFAARAGYDPRAAVTFWQKMIAQQNAAGSAGASGKFAALLSTHPPDAQRIAALQAMMPQVLPIYEQNKGKFQ